MAAEMDIDRGMCGHVWKTACSLVIEYILTTRVVRQMLDWKAHLNVEFTANPHSILYLYSYLLKGWKKVTGQATSDDPTISNDGIADEVDIYVKGRLLCAHDATGRALGYPTYPATEPACKVVAVKTEAQVNFFLAEKRATDMYLYMASRNIAAVCNLSFVDFFRQYYGTYTAPTQARRARGDYFEIPSPDPSKRLYVFKYHVQPNHIVRVEMLFPSVGDAWYLRLILRMRPVVDWEDARSYPPKGQLGSTVYASHQEAAQRAGYLVGELFDEAMLCFAEAMVDSTPHVLRGLFCVLTLDGFVTGNILRDEQCVERLTDDYTTQGGKSPGEAFIMMLQDLKRRLAQQQKTLEDFGLHVDPVTNLPYVLEGRSELDEEKARYDPGQQGRVFSALEHRYPSNVEQQHAVDTILQAVETARTRGEQQFVCMHLLPRKTPANSQLRCHAASAVDTLALTSSDVVATTAGVSFPNSMRGCGMDGCIRPAGLPAYLDGRLLVAFPM